MVYTRLGHDGCGTMLRHGEELFKTCVVEGPGVRSSVFDIFALVGYARLLAGPSEPVTRAASDGRGQRLEVTLRGVGWPLGEQKQV